MSKSKRKDLTGFVSKNRDRIGEAVRSGTYHLPRVIAEEARKEHGYSDTTYWHDIWRSLLRTHIDLNLGITKKPAKAPASEEQQQIKHNSMATSIRTEIKQWSAAHDKDMYDTIKDLSNQGRIVSIVVTEYLPGGISTVPNRALIVWEREEFVDLGPM